MPEDLQALIDRVQRDAVDEGQRRARAIVAEAEATAAALVRDAEAKAAAILERAERDALAFTERSSAALDHAGRDLLIAVSQSIERVLAALVHESLMETLDPDLLADMLVAMADAYGARGGRERRMTVLLGPDDLDALVRLYAQRLRERLPQGVELRLDNSVVKGFRVAIVDEHVEHDFTIDAIAEALTHHLRPHLARILPRAVTNVRHHGVDGRDGRPAVEPTGEPGADAGGERR
jgi:V/A-type H+/Na+-transporting ATPase subunit E